MQSPNSNFFYKTTTIPNVVKTLSMEQKRKRKCKDENKLIKQKKSFG